MDYFSSLNASSLDPDVPTLFELLSTRELDNLIAPSLRYIVAYYAQRNPQYLLRIANRFDELYLILMGSVEYYHLRNWNASFTEKFYGLKRVNTLNIIGLGTRAAVPHLLEKHKRLTRRQVLGSLFFAVVEPHIREKLDTRYEMLKGRYAFRSIESDRDEIYATGSATDKLRYELDRLLLRWYPTATFVRSGVTLSFYLLFLFSKTTRSSFPEWLLNMRYSRLNDFDYRRQESASGGQSIAELMRSGRPLAAAKNAALGGLSYALPTSMFLLKFLEWWYSSDFARQMSRKSRGLDESLNVPESAEPAVGGNGTSAKECPLCGEEMENPTAIETGIVFCYTCIYRHLRDAPKETGGRCPVTGQRLLQCTYSEESGEWDVGGLRRLMI